MQKLLVSSSPHLKSHDTTPAIMRDVLIALCPSLIAATVIFGIRALLLTIVCVCTSVLTEYAARKVMKRDTTIDDLSAAVTGMLLAFNLPSSLPLWMAMIGCVFSILVVKQFFGGIGQNFVNPALAGRIVLMVSFPTQMSSWPAPFGWRSATAMTTASPMASLGTLFQNGQTSASSMDGSHSLPTLLEMLFGQRQGSLGEVCAIALILGGLYLLWLKVISPIIPLTYIGTVAVIMLIAGHGSVTFMLYQLLGGGLLLGAIFMATDYTTSPLSKKGKFIFAIGCGVITCVIRLFGSLPEGVSFSIILMNILVPHIERLTVPKPFGAPEKKKKGGEKA